MALLMAVLAAAFALVPGPATGQGVGSLGVGVLVPFDDPVTVGEQNQPAQLILTNISSGDAALQPVTITNVRLNPSCATSTVDPGGPSPCQVPEPRPNPAAEIFHLDPTSTSTTCTGGPFIITGPDAEGDYTFTPTTGPVILSPVGQPGSSCVINFTFDVIQRPNDGLTFQNAALVATSASFPGGAPQTGVGDVTVLQATPTLATVASTNSTTVPPGSTVTDQATVTGVAGGPTPTGTVTYTLAGPNPNANCTAPTVAPNGPATVPVGQPSPGYTVTAPGTYNFVASYSGDANYAPVAAVGCGDPLEQFAVALRTLTLATQASTNATDVPSGTTVTDATIFTVPAGGPTPTGTVTYTLTGPNPNATCTSPVVGTATVPAGQPSPPFTVTLPGTYNFTATYSGDANYAPVTTPVGCGDPAEQFTVARVPVQLVTQASTNSTTVAPGTVVTDTATLTAPAGFPAPTGTVTYTLVGPNPNATCTAPVVGTSTVAAGQPSGPFTVNAPGTYNFVATYSGDANYLPITTPVGCGVPNEMFTVQPLAIGLTTQASTNAPNLPPGTPVTDTAVFTPPPGGPAPTGTVTYTLVGPNPNATCTAPIFGTPSTAPVGSPSAPYAPTAPGTYNFVATYSGDANYAPIATPVGCGDPDEIFGIALQTVTFATQASTNGTVAPGTAVTDLATFTPPAGGPPPTGTVTYTLVGPNPDANCTAPVVGTSTVAVGAPSAPFTVTAPGTYNFVATYSGDGFYAPITTPVGCGVPAEQFSVALQPATLTTQASTNSTTVPPGSTVTDLATVAVPAGSPPATGTVTYTLVGPNPNATCTAPVVGTSTVPVGQPSGPFTVTAVGTYNFVATYSGDANYLPITTPVGCGVPAEQFAVALRPLGLTTQASTNAPNVAPGTPVTDVATFTPPAGGPAPTGTVTYTLVGPNPNATCTAPVFGTATAPVGTPSTPFSPTAPGTYNFVATYSGDANYAPVTTPVGCGDPNEIFAIALQPVNLVTQASTNAPNVTPGATVTDTATLTPVNPGGPAPTGTVTYTLVGPNPNATCTAPVVGTSTVPAGQPSGPFTVTAVGTYNFVATYSGDAFYQAITTPVGCNVPAERFAVAVAPTAIVTQASPPVPVGGQIFDTATLSGGVNPTGTITFTLFGPDNPTCTGTPIFTSTVPVNGNGNYTSGAHTVAAAGSYRWIAAYSGDANNAPAGPTACADPLEQTAGERVTPQLVTVASAGTVGGQVFDTATLSGGFNPTGTITFQLFGPNDDDCSGPPIFTNVKPVTGNGNVQSDPFILPASGVYHFVATYSGDANNNRVGPTACDDPNETVGVGRAIISLSTLASPSVPAGGIIFDTATVAGGFNPTGTITFNLYGPDDATCTGTPVFTSVVQVNGNGSYPSTSFTPTVPGTYRWVASYSGDANNAPATTACNDPLEQVVVTPLPTIMVDKTATPESLPVPGGTFTFRVVVTNTSTVPLTIRTLTDNIYGNITTIPGSTCNTAIGTVLAPSPGPGNTYTCQFPGTFFGPGGASQTDIVTVTATDNRGNTVRDDDDAIVRITPVPPTITTTKTASPPSMQEPGGTFTFFFSVTNTGPVPVTITSLVDDVYGNLNGRGTCAIGARLAPNGGTYTCSFQGNFFGNAGARQTDTITTIAVDDQGQQVTSQAQATVTITDVPPAIRIVKTANPISRPEPGGTFRFTVTITNPSFEPITTTSLVDDIYGDLNGRGSCAIGVVLAANGGTYSCEFDGDFRGRAGDSQTDTVTVVAVDDEGTRVTAFARATVTLTPVSVPPVVQPPPPPPVVVQPPPRVLVRTGGDLDGPIRLAGILVLVGMVLIAASWKFGNGGSGLAVLPVGPSGGPGGGSGGSGGNWFSPTPEVPPGGGPLGGLGAGFRPLAPAAAPAPEVEAEPAPEPERQPEPEQAWDEWVVADRRVIPAASVEVSPAAPVLADEDEVVVPTVLPFRATGGLDAAALDAANAEPAHHAGPVPPPGRRHGRRFGGR